MTYPFRRIVFPVDFSKRCEAIVPAVRALAAKYGSSITLFHALDMPPIGYAEWYAYSVSVDVEAIREHSRKSLDQFAARLFAGVPNVTTVVREGSPVESLAAHLKDHPADLVMMASHGHSKFRSLLLGSVTSGVLHDIALPVWTAAHALEDPPHTDTMRNIICAVDLEAKNTNVLRIAKEIAVDYDAKLHIVHSEPAVEDLSQSESAARFRRFLEFRAKEDYAPLAAAAGIEEPVLVVEGPVGESIAAVARNNNADLVVIGRGVVQGTLGRLRTHATEILQRSPCPVLSI
jgi:nucleotide-binding universal stress UspA family protein